MVKKRGVNKRSTHVRVAPSSGAALSSLAFGHALGILVLIAVIFYTLFVWFGGYSGIGVADNFPISFSFNDWTFIFGLIQAYVLGYIAGWVFVRVYNRAR